MSTKMMMMRVETSVGYGRVATIAQVTIYFVILNLSQLDQPANAHVVRASIV